MATQEMTESAQRRVGNFREVREGWQRRQHVQSFERMEFTRQTRGGSGHGTQKH